MAQFSTLREKIAFESRERRERYATFASLVTKAHEAGLKAGEAFNPTPMVVGDADGLSTRFKPGTQLYFVADGVCGFAWVQLPKATSSFARWAIKNKIARKSYRGGADIWCSAFNQSMQRKEAYCEAYAKVLREGGIDCYVGSRLD